MEYYIFKKCISTQKVERNFFLTIKVFSTAKSANKGTILHNYYEEYITALSNTK